jgi:serine/threonine-protein kinase
MRVHFSGWTFDSAAHELRSGGKVAHLSGKPLRLLEVLIDHRPAAVSKQTLLETIWPASTVDESALPTLVREVRTILGDDARHPAIIRTVHRYGYAFSAEASEEKPLPAKIESVAVLPFVSLSGPDWDHLSDGIAEELIFALTKLQSIRVAPRSTSFRYRSPHPDLRSAAAEMRVKAIVTGRVSVRDGVLTIQAELINTTTDSQLWGGRFHGPVAELQDLERRVESEIMVQVVERASAGEQRIPIVRNSEAYEHYLRGQHQLNRRDAGGFERAIELFTAATTIDRGFAVAHAALAEAYVALGSRDIRPAYETFPAARSAALQALDCDRSVASAWSALASVQELFEWKWNEAEQTHRTAVKLDPTYANAAQWFGLHYARRGNHDEARYWIKRALANDPYSPIINTNAAFIAYLAGDYDAAMRQSDIALDLAPHYEAARIMSGVANIQVNPGRAVLQLEEAARLSSRQPYVLSHLASAYDAVSRLDDAIRIAAELDAAATERYVSPLDRAVAALACGNRSSALDKIEEGLDKRSAWLVYIPLDPRTRVLAGDKRFQAVMAALGIQKWH